MRVTLRISRPVKSAAALGVVAAVMVNAITAKQQQAKIWTFIRVSLRNMIELFLRLI
jgi:hypothetical protein